MTRNGHAKPCRAVVIPWWVGVWIEDKSSGTILLQQAIRRQWPATAIDSKLTAMGKDERALSVSGYVYRGSVEYTDYAFDKTTVHKRKTRKQRAGF
jgi:hypothetical protein